MKKLIIILGLIATVSFANGPQGGGNSQEMREPPAEALSACNSKSDGDSCDITTPHGESITGTCQNTPDGKYFVCMPSNRENKRPAF